MNKRAGGFVTEGEPNHWRTKTMKTRFALASLALVGGFAALASPAAAHSDIRISVGFGVRPPAPVVYVPAPAPVYTAPRCEVPAYATPVYSSPGYGARHARPSGYWKEVVVRSWVPERCYTSYDRWSRPVRVVEPGHYAFRTERVWVNDCR
jgi:hypothetical protein